MSKIVDEVLKANEKYQSDFGDKGKLALPPARGFARRGTDPDAPPGARFIPVYGYLYQVETGRLVEVPEATRIGRAG